MKSLSMLCLSGTMVIILVTVIVSVSYQPQIFAEKEEKKLYTSANEIQIHTVLKSRMGSEESDGFQVFKQISGYDGQSEHPVFKLEGVMSHDKPLLYELADIQYSRGANNRNSIASQFEMDVILHRDGIPYRHFAYGDCIISDYDVNTLFDKEEGWTTSKGFAIIDEFTFECNGYNPQNPMFELVKTDGYHVESDTISSNDLTDTSTWPQNMRMN